VIVLGGRIDLCKQAASIYKNHFSFEAVPLFEYCSVKEAEELKYTHNIYHAYKVLYWNFVHEATGNQRKIWEMYSLITGNKNEMARVCADGHFGYGGACFPKDVGAFHEEHPNKLTAFMIMYNHFLRGDYE
jgi:UDP-glucose 6-dehydrogenase